MLMPTPHIPQWFNFRKISTSQYVVFQYKNFSGRTAKAYSEPLRTANKLPLASIPWLSISEVLDL